MRNLTVEKRGRVAQISEQISDKESRVWTFSTERDAAKQAPEFNLPGEVFTPSAAPTPTPTPTPIASAPRSLLSRALDFIA